MIRVKFWHADSQRYVFGWLGQDSKLGKPQSHILGDDGVNYFCIPWGLIVRLYQPAPCSPLDAGPL